ncbi:MAG TPA: TetR/AcrR family transcriptional regulator [Candidatus Binataceae bacterium]|nr:TetR/AcrR family transcriptional regulator [Candidatus Binataceae bacterium]
MEYGARARASRARQHAILQAALHLFLEKGFGATTLDQILERSKASVGSFYHHFQSKIDVAVALYLGTLEAYQAAFLDELQRHSDARGGIEGAVRHHLRWTARNPELAAYLMHCREPEVAEASEARVQQLNRTFFEQTGAWLVGQVKAGEVRRLSAPLYYALWMGASDEFTRLWLLEPQPRDFRQLVTAAELLAETAWENLRARRLKPN